MREIREIQFVVVGFGHIGKRHAEEINGHPNAVLVAVVDIDENARTLAADMYKVPVFTSISECARHMANSDIYCICAPNGLHISLAEEAVMAGKHVLIEKPMGLQSEACHKLIAKAEVQDVNIYCVLQNRYSPPARFLKELVENNKLGKIYWAEVHCFWNRDWRYYTPNSWRGTLDMDGGPLFTQFSHFVDLLYWLFGPLKLNGAQFYNMNHPRLEGIEDTGFFSFDIERGGSGLFSYSTSLWDKNMESSITIIGEEGSLKAGGQYMDKIEYFHVAGMDSPQLPKSNPPNHYGSYQGSAANHSFVIDNVVKAMNQQPFELASVEEAMASVKLIEEVYSMR